MSTVVASTTLRRPRAVAATVDRERLSVDLKDGRRISVPLEWFSWLADASDEDRQAFQLLGGGEGLWWDRLDDGISVPVLLGVPEWVSTPRLTQYSVEYHREGRRWVAEIPDLESSTWGPTLAAAQSEARGVLAMLLGVADLESAGIEVLDVVASDQPIDKA